MFAVFLLGSQGWGGNCSDIFTCSYIGLFKPVDCEELTYTSPQNSIPDDFINKLQLGQKFQSSLQCF